MKTDRDRIVAIEKCITEYAPEEAVRRIQAFILSKICPDCKGTGQVEKKASPNPKQIGMVILECNRCNGTGEI